MRLDDWLSRAAEGVPRQPALIAGERTMTFAELEQEAVAAARRFAGLGVGRATAWRCLPSPRSSMPCCCTASRSWVRWRRRSTRSAPGTEQVALLGALEAALVVREPGEVLDAPERADVPLDASLDSDAPHSVIHTSGTSGEPKAVTLTYGNHLWNAVGSGVRIGVSPSDRWLCCMPLHHVGGFAILVRGALYRIAVELEPFDDGRGRRGGGRAPRDDRVARADDAHAAAGRGRSARAACGVR